MFQPTQLSTIKLTLALTLYLTSLFASNTLGLKIMPFLFGSHLSVAVFYFPVVFLMTDIVGEVYGRKIAKLFVTAGFVSTALFLAYSYLSLLMPWSIAGAWVETGCNQVFGISTRIALASLVAYAIAEYQDVFSFFFFRKMWGSKLLWLRSLLSNAWSQLLDSVIFMVIAFAGVYSNQVLVSIIISWWLYKVIMGFLYTPLLYLGVKLLTNKNEHASSTN